MRKYIKAVNPETFDPYIAVMENGELLERIFPQDPRWQEYAIRDNGVPILQDKYFLFAAESYYAGGGWKDYKGVFGTIEQALEFLKGIADDIGYGHWHIVEIATKKIVKRGQLTWGNEVIEISEDEDEEESEE